MRGGVLVQAAPTEAETAFLLDAADASPCVPAVVGWVDLLAPDAPERIRARAAHPKLKGLRPMLHDIGNPDWILQPALTPALRAMAEHGLVFDALIRPPHLPCIVELARRFPSLRIVIDHAAKPAIAQRQWQPWADALRHVAIETEAACKLSGLLTEAAPGDAIEPWAQHVLECFGPERVLWGSDWPVLETAGAYDDWWRLAQAVMQRFGDDARQAVFGANAVRVYRIEPASSPA